MLGSSSRFLDGLRASHTVLARATVVDYLGASEQYEVVDGSITIDGRGNIWRNATLTLMHDDVRKLSKIDVTDKVVLEYGMRYFDHAIEWITVGTFWVQEIVQQYPAQTVQVTLFDVGTKVEDYRLVTPYVPISNAGSRMNNYEAVEDLLRIVDASIPVNFDAGLATGSAVPEGTVFTGSRWDALQTFAKAMGAVVHGDEKGHWRVHKISGIGSPSWQVNAGDGGVLVSAASVRSRREQFNAVPVRWETPGGGGLLFLTDGDPNSPTRWGGPFGKRPAEETSIGTITSESEATAAAVALLTQYKGFSRSVSFSAIANPLLEPLDIVRLHLPGEQVEDHIIDSVNYQIGDGVMSCETRLVRTPTATTGVEA